MNAVDKDVTDLVFHGRPPAKEWPWAPSGNIRQAMMVADEIMRTKTLNFKLYRNVELVPDQVSWNCTFSQLGTPPSRKCSIYEADAETPELAICRAAMEVARDAGRHIVVPGGGDAK